MLLKGSLQTTCIKVTWGVHEMYRQSQAACQACWIRLSGQEAYKSAFLISTLGDFIHTKVCEAVWHGQCPKIFLRATKGEDKRILVMIRSFSMFKLFFFGLNDCKLRRKREERDISMPRGLSTVSQRTC